MTQIQFNITKQYSGVDDQTHSIMEVSENASFTAEHSDSVTSTGTTCYIQPTININNAFQTEQKYVTVNIHLQCCHG